MKGKKSCPLAARIKKLMQADDDVGKIAQATPVMLARAMELFLQQLCEKTAAVAVSRQAKTITTSHLKQCVSVEETLDFLKEVVASAPDLPPEDATKPPKRRRAAPAGDGDGDGEQSSGKKPRGRPKKLQQEADGAGAGGADDAVDVDGSGAQVASKPKRPRAPRRKAQTGGDDQSDSDHGGVDADTPAEKPARRSRASKSAALSAFQTLADDIHGAAHAGEDGLDGGGNAAPRRARHKQVSAAQHMQGLDAPKIPPVQQDVLPAREIPIKAELVSPRTNAAKASSATQLAVKAAAVSSGTGAGEAKVAAMDSQPAASATPQAANLQLQHHPAGFAAMAESGIQGSPACTEPMQDLRRTTSTEGGAAATATSVVAPACGLQLLPPAVSKTSTAAAPGVKKEKPPSAGTSASSLRSSLVFSSRKMTSKKAAGAAIAPGAVPAPATSAMRASPLADMAEGSQPAAASPSGAAAAASTVQPPVTSVNTTSPSPALSTVGPADAAVLAGAPPAAAPPQAPVTCDSSALPPQPSALTAAAEALPAASLPPMAHLAHLAAASTQDYDDDYDNL